MAMYKMHGIENNNFHQRKVLSLQKLEKKKRFSQSLSFIHRLRNLWTKDGSNSSSASIETLDSCHVESTATSRVKKHSIEERCSTLPRNARLGKNVLITILFVTLDVIFYVFYLVVKNCFHNWFVNLISSILSEFYEN